MIDYAAARRAMVDCQVRPSDVTRYGIIEAMLWAPRERFVPKALREVAYSDGEIPLGRDRVLMAPRTFAKMLEAAAIGRDALVLDLAPGTGYSTAVISRLAQAVVAVEPEEAFASEAQEAFDELEVMNAAITVGAPADGDPAHGPYDVIFINGAVQCLPESLTAQLKDGGRLVAIFDNGGAGQCRVVVRSGATLSDRVVFDASAQVVPGFEREEAFSF